MPTRSGTLAFKFHTELCCPCSFTKKVNSSFITVALYIYLILTDYVRCQTEITLLTFFVGFVMWGFFSGRVGVGWNFLDNMEGSILLFPLDSIEWKLKLRQFLTLKVLAYSVIVPKAKDPITANLYLNEE